jgi:hypothetical protein
MSSRVRFSPTPAAKFYLAYLGMLGTVLIIVAVLTNA